MHHSCASSKASASPNRLKIVRTKPGLLFHSKNSTRDASAVVSTSLTCFANVDQNDAIHPNHRKS